MPLKNEEDEYDLYPCLGLSWINPGAGNFSKEKGAKIRKKEIRSHGFNPDYDEIDIFEKIV